MGNKYFFSNSNCVFEYVLFGLDGEVRMLRLELKLLVEVGIIGLFNVGKFILIVVFFAVCLKIVDYFFIILVLNLGVVRKFMGDGIVFVDILGLIEGVFVGLGLGYEFLRYIEWIWLLLYLVDIMDVDLVENFEII